MRPLAPTVELTSGSGLVRACLPEAGWTQAERDAMLPKLARTRAAIRRNLVLRAGEGDEGAATLLAVWAPDEEVLGDWTPYHSYQLEIPDDYATG